MIPSIPNTNGTIVLKLPQGSSVPPQQIAIRNAVVLLIKRKPPNQSTRASFSLTEEVLGFSVKTSGMVMNPIKQNGNIR
jgi:hypothetical protein